MTGGPCHLGAQGGCPACQHYRAGPATSGGAAASRSWPPVDTTMWIKETATRGGRRRQLLLDMHSHCVEQATCEAWASGAAAASAARRLREHSKPAAGRRHLF